MGDTQLLLYEVGRSGARRGPHRLHHFAGYGRCGAQSTRAGVADGAVRSGRSRAAAEQPLYRPCRNGGGQRSYRPAKELGRPPPLRAAAGLYRNAHALERHYGKQQLPIARPRGADLGQSGHEPLRETGDGVHLRRGRGRHRPCVGGYARGGYGAAFQPGAVRKPCPEDRPASVQGTTDGDGKSETGAQRHRAGTEYGTVRANSIAATRERRDRTGKSCDGAWRHRAGAKNRIIRPNSQAADTTGCTVHGAAFGNYGRYIRRRAAVPSRSRSVLAGHRRPLVSGRGRGENPDGRGPPRRKAADGTFIRANDALPGRSGFAASFPTNRRIPAAGNLRSSSRNSSARRPAPSRRGTAGSAFRPAAESGTVSGRPDAGTRTFR